MSERTIRATLCTVIGLLILALGGCTAAPKRGEVQREWAQTLRELGIQPVFPPREDVHVGDVYLRRGAPNDHTLIVNKGYVPVDQWVSHVNVTTELEAFYGARLSFPSTDDPTAPDPGNDQGGGAAGTGMIRVPTRADGTGSVFADHHRDRLRQVAFPDFTSMTIKEGNLRGLVPIEALTVAFGADWSSNHQVDVKIPAAESYGLPTSALLGKATTTEDGTGSLRLNEETTGLTLPMLGLLRTGLAYVGPTKGSRSRAVRGEEDSHIYLDLISEVFYTRVIDISIAKQSSVGAGATVKTIDAAIAGEQQAPSEPPPAAPPAADADGENEAAEPDPPAASPPAPSPPSAATDVQFTAQQRARELNRSLDDIEKQSDIGGSVRFLSVSANGVQMRRTYERPIAIGFRSVTMRVDTTTGKVTAATASSHSPIAQTTAGSEQLRRAMSRVIRRELGRSVDAVTIQAQDQLVIAVQPASGTTLSTVEAAIRQARGTIAETVETELGADPDDEDRRFIELLRTGTFEVVFDEE